MNSTLMKVAFAYIAGIGTYALFQNHNLIDKVDKMNIQLMSQDEEVSDSVVTGTSCPCGNDDRYNVDPPTDSKNYAISSIPACSTMVANGNPDPRGTVTGKGAWFSKITLDNMFCHKPDANGIYVYKALTDAGEVTFIVEAARTNNIVSPDDGSSYIYYSRAMCPTMCGVCAM